MTGLSGIALNSLDYHWEKIRNQEHSGPILTAIGVVLLTYVFYNVWPLLSQTSNTGCSARGQYTNEMNKGAFRY